MIIKSEFESKITKTNIYTIVDYSDLDKLKIELEMCRGHIIAKLSDSQTSIINFLEKMGFLYSVSSLSLECSLDKPADRGNENIKELHEDDADFLYEICDESFMINNRYANDLYLKDFVKKIHRTWAFNSVNGYADYSCGYMFNDKVVGFGTLHFHDEHSIIGLLAIAKEYRNKSIASKLIDCLIERSWRDGKKRIIVSTELNNFPALNLYIKKKFRFYYSEISLYRMIP